MQLKVRHRFAHARSGNGLYTDRADSTVKQLVDITMPLVTDVTGLKKAVHPTTPMVCLWTMLHAEQQTIARRWSVRLVSVTSWGLWSICDLYGEGRAQPAWGHNTPGCGGLEGCSRSQEQEGGKQHVASTDQVDGQCALHP